MGQKAGISNCHSRFLTAAAYCSVGLSNDYGEVIDYTWVSEIAEKERRRERHNSSVVGFHPGARTACRGLKVEQLYCSTE